MGPMRARRTRMSLLVAGALLFAGTVDAFWIEWKRSALPADEALAPRILALVVPDNDGKPGLEFAVAQWAFWRDAKGAPSRLTVGGWEFRANLDLWSWNGEDLEPLPVGDFLVRTQPPDDFPRATLYARPVSPMAKLRFRLGIYGNDDWWFTVVGP